MQLILQRWIRGYLCCTENDVRAFDSAKSHFAVPRVDDAWRWPVIYQERIFYLFPIILAHLFIGYFRFEITDQEASTNDWRWLESPTKSTIRYSSWLHHIFARKESKSLYWRQLQSLQPIQRLQFRRPLKEKVPPHEPRKPCADLIPSMSVDRHPEGVVKFF